MPLQLSEVLFLPDPDSDEATRRRAFIEIRQPNFDYSLNGCRLENDDGSLRVDFGDSFDYNEKPYFLVVKSKPTLETDFKVQKNQGRPILWMRDFTLNSIDSIALFCGEDMIDFVAWGKDGVAPNGPLVQMAVDALQWKTTDSFVETGVQDFGNDFAIQGIQAGDSIIRRIFEEDTNSVADWSFYLSRVPSPHDFGHVYRSALPVINEIMFLPDPSSLNVEQQRSFIEIFRTDINYPNPLTGCTIVNNDATFRVDFTKSMNIGRNYHISIMHDEELEQELRVGSEADTLWTRSFVLNKEVDGIGLFCHDQIVDYVAWGRGVAPTGTLHSAAITADLWERNDDFIDTSSVDLGNGIVISGVQKGESLGRDRFSTITHSRKDWSYPGGLNSRIATPSSRNFQHTHLPSINEVLFQPNPQSKNAKKRRAFIEIYRADKTFNLNGCSLMNDAGSFQLDFDSSFDSIRRRYFSVKHKAEMSVETKLARGKGILWVRDIKLNEIVDGIALVCDGQIADYIAWGSALGPDGTLHRAAVAARKWSGADEFVYTGPLDLGNGLVTRGMRRGDSLGRDSKSTNTNSVSDWSYSGGIDANGPTPSFQNREPSYFPVVNEVMFLPDPDSRDINKRRSFVEIYRRNLSYKLSRCTLANSDASFRVDFGKSANKVDNPYFVVKHKSSLDKPFKLSDSTGILWMRDFVLNDDSDGLVLICNGAIVDYVAWGKGDMVPTGTVHDAAVAVRMWNNTNDFVHLSPQVLSGGYSKPGLQIGESLGRDADSNNTNNPKDWTFPGGRNAQSATPSAQNRGGRYDLPVINEVFLMAYLYDTNVRKRRNFIEIYRPDTSYSLSGCSLVNDNRDSSRFRVDFDESIDGMKKSYFSVKHKETLDSAFKLVKSQGILWMRDFLLSEYNDGVALICNNTIVDYVAWGKGSHRPGKTLHMAAVESGAWSGLEDFVQLSPKDRNDLRLGESFGRDKESTDTNSPMDWTFPGGLNARNPTPSRKNLEFSALPIMNEVLFLPDPNSRKVNERVSFIEIYRPDTSFRLGNCGLRNGDETFQIERFDHNVGMTINSLKHPYLTFRHNATLDGPAKLDKKAGIYWTRFMNLDTSHESLALYCDGGMIDYLEWDEEGTARNDELHNIAVRNGMWKSTDGSVMTSGVVKGTSVGRDSDSTDTNSVVDWTYPGGLDADGATPGSRNEIIDQPTQDPTTTTTTTTSAPPTRPPPVLAVSAKWLASQGESIPVD